MDRGAAYLGRYTHRVAISNPRLVDFAGDRVRFRWRDYADGKRVKVMDLDADEFLRRVLLDIVSNGFVRIRHFGLLAHRRRTANLTQCRSLLAQPPAPPRLPPESVRAVMLRVTGVDIDRCPVCHRGVLRRRERLRPTASPGDAS
ncbi:MAG: transposase [Candidatus Rokubacteria bacterium]|nr:transposase [Candidatus Rokubacteria bacterium]